MRVGATTSKNDFSDARKLCRALNAKLPQYCTAEVSRHGRVVVYFRQVGRTGRIRMRPEPLSHEFFRLYAHLLGAQAPSPTAKQKAGDETWRWLCERYFQSIAYKELADIGQRVRRRQLEMTWDEPIAPGSHLTFGDCPVRNLNAKSVRILRERKLKWIAGRRSNTEAANSLVKYLRAVFAFGVDDYSNLIERNWARDVGYLSSGGEGFHTWTLEEIAQFESRHPIGTKARLALALALYGAQRRGDVATLGKHLERNGMLVFEQEKNRRRAPVIAYLPISPALRAIIDASPTGEQFYLVQDRLDRPYKKESLGNKFKTWCIEAGLPHCSLHGLRKAGVVRLIQEDAAPHAIMAVTGHRTLKEIDRYAREYAREQEAEKMLVRWLAEHGGN